VFTIENPTTPRSSDELDQEGVFLAETLSAITAGAVENLAAVDGILGQANTWHS
jgi:hypothetical protein